MYYNALECADTWCNVIYLSWVINFCCCVSSRHFPDKTKWCNLKMLVTWVGLLNLYKVCAIFSVSMVPQPCPAHSLQFVRFRHIISAREIVPHTTGAPVAAEPTSSNLWLTDYWLTEAFWDIMRRSAKHAGLQRHIQEAPVSLLSFPKLPQKPTSTERTDSLEMCVAPQLFQTARP